MQKHSTILRKDSVDTVAIGSFDGVHLGHKELIKRLGKNGALFVVDKDQANLTPGVKRSEYSKYPCMFYHFLKLKNLSGAEFIELLKKEFPALKKIVVGYDFKFGANKSCDAQMLKNMYDGEVEIVEEFKYKNISVHSSTIRELIKCGDIVKANGFLGREYAIQGDVIQGQGIGKKETFPTLNLKVRDYLFPKEGVYATRTRIGFSVYDSVSFIGVRQSTDNLFSIETHIINEKIENVTLAEIFFVDFLRENIKFSNLRQLKEQICKDIKNAKERLSSCKLYLMDFLEQE
ncbi:MAG: bifunctional riboflavin kinase/FAD synthetase [Sulfurospirillaceae bacterium]|nr:bifunctional riboflavin kinase/FAD synthetase [Sulfurospirillaceae bacterium]MDD3462930.1 bifunctional riboflavin kinase/FAD synthetase [Sulfurospirillaceae bacterium]